MSEIPDNLGYTEDHEWVGQDEGNGVKVGITDYAQDSLSDVVFVELPNVGDEYQRGEVMAVAESVKAASDIYAPISGKILAVNEKFDLEFGWEAIYLKMTYSEEFADQQTYNNDENPKINTYLN